MSHSLHRLLGGATPKVRALCELVRLPNVFTAVADVVAGYWLVSGAWGWSNELGLLMLASAALYSAGIVFNDLADRNVDRIERPHRPIPSGRIGVREAWSLAIGLAVIGVGAATLSGAVHFVVIPRTTLFAAALVLMIVAYDFLLKETFLGPLAMAACRTLNFLMGVAACLPLPLDTPAFQVASVLRTVLLLSAAIFLYVASLTYFGKQEASQSPRRRLIAGGIGLGIALWTVGSVSLVRGGDSFTLVLWLALAIHMGRVTLRAIRHPSPMIVQYAMKTFILGIIAFDAVIASAVHGWPAGVMVLSLLLPALLIGRWVYVT